MTMTLHSVVSAKFRQSMRVASWTMPTPIAGAACDLLFVTGLWPQQALKIVPDIDRRGPGTEAETDMIVGPGCSKQVWYGI
jgi:hypothetical protein